MRNILKKIIVFKLALLAQLYLWRFKPEIVAITGNVGKTSTKEAITVVLSKIKKVRHSKGNLNNEFGVPLTIIGDWTDDYYESGNTFWFWIKVLTKGIGYLFVPKRYLTAYPEILVLEFGADRPGDIERLTKKYKPKVGVVTAVGEVPVHVEYFSSPEALGKEKSRMVACLPPDGYAILNYDDPVVAGMREKTKAKTMSYGFTEGALVRILDYNIRQDENQKATGVRFKVNHGEHTFVPFNINGSLGRSHAFATGAAVCVGIIYGMNLVEMSEAISQYDGPKGRLKVLAGIKDSTIIDDTYNAAPASMHLALEILKELSAKRKIAVLGDMLELGKYTIEAHEEAGNLLGTDIDVLVTIGSRAKFIAQSALNQMPGENVFSFETSDLAKRKVQELIEERDTILVKGSQGVRMEKVVEEIMAEPERKEKLLVRQSKRWRKK